MATKELWALWSGLRDIATQLDAVISSDSHGFTDEELEGLKHAQLQIRYAELQVKRRNRERD